jgi:sortase (surface protein transpeptidase)
MVPAKDLPGLVEWRVPDHRAAGWLNTSAAWGQAGNTVLAGHHNIRGEVFRDLWTLQPGDEIDLFAGEQMRHYEVKSLSENLLARYNLQLLKKQRSRRE